MVATHQFKRSLSFLVYSNLFIAACALALCAETFLLLQLPPSIDWFLLLLPLSTLFVYGLHYFRKTGKSQSDARLDWCRKNKLVLLFLLAASGIGVAAAVVYYRKEIFLINGNLNYINLFFFLVIPLLSLGYSHPFIPRMKKGIRQVGWLKLVLLSFIWSFTTTLLPVLMINNQEVLPHTFLQLSILFLHRFFFVAGLCVLFNINDVKEDEADGVKTIAVMLGPEKTLARGKWLFFLLNTIFAILLLAVFTLYYPLFYIAVSIPVALVFLQFRYFKTGTNEADFVLRTDGLMIVQALLLIFALLITSYK
jgi:4-hydroxybenzoate polyprenyltransferase